MARGDSSSGFRGWFITGTDTGVGKTIVGGALALLLRQTGLRIGVFKPVATGCRPDVRLGLVSGDAEFLAHCAESADDLATINPVRYAPELAPMVAAERSQRPIDWACIEECWQRIRSHSDVVLVEGVGGLLVPLDVRTSVADYAARLGLPLLIVGRAGLGTINHTLLTMEAARARGLRVDAVILNLYQSSLPTLAEETNPDAIARLGRVPMPIVIPFDPAVAPDRGRLTESILFPLRPLVRHAVG